MGWASLSFSVREMVESTIYIRKSQKVSNQVEMAKSDIALGQLPEYAWAPQDITYTGCGMSVLRNRAFHKSLRVFVLEAENKLNFLIKILLRRSEKEVMDEGGG